MTVETITHKEVLKINAIRIAEHHRKHCDGEHCNISLMLLAELLQIAGVKLTQEELAKFV